MSFLTRICAKLRFQRSPALFLRDRNSSETANMAKFMDLPREIRDMIYKLLLTVGAEIVTHPTYYEDSTDFEAEGVNRPAVALLSVNKQIGAEAAAILYGNNTWRIRESDHYIRGLEIYQDHGHLFRHITIHLDRRDIEELETTNRIEQYQEQWASLTMEERMKLVHDERLDDLRQLIYRRGHIITSDMKLIRSLALVIDGLYCPSECCRLDIVKDLYDDFLCMFIPDPRTGLAPEEFPQLEVRVTGLKSQAENDLVYGEWGIKGAAVEQDTA